MQLFTEYLERISKLNDFRYVYKYLQKTPQHLLPRFHRCNNVLELFQIKRTIFNYLKRKKMSCEDKAKDNVMRCCA